MYPNNQVFFVHGQVQTYTAARHYSLKQWLNDHHINYQQDGDNFYVIGDQGQRTGEAYSLLNIVPTDDPETI